MTTKTSRRAILAGAATLPALAMPAVAPAATPDPIFAAIEAHKAACAAFHRGRWTVDEVGDALGRANDDALSELLTTVPTSIAGCIAALRALHRYLRDHENDEALFSNSTAPLCEDGMEFLGVIADALETAVRS